MEPNPLLNSFKGTIDPRIECFHQSNFSGDIKSLSVEISTNSASKLRFSIFVYGRKFKLAMSRQAAVECSEHHQHGSEPSRGSLATGLNVPFSPWSHFCHEHACRADDGGNHGDTQETSDGSNGDGHGAAGGGVDMAAVMGLIGSLTDR